mgnify:CR=1 FL=1
MTGRLLICPLNLNEANVLVEWFWVGDSVMVRFCLNKPCIGHGRGSKIGMQAKKGLRLVAEDWE